MAYSNLNQHQYWRPKKNYYIWEQACEHQFINVRVDITTKNEEETGNESKHDENDSNDDENKSNNDENESNHDHDMHIQCVNYLELSKIRELSLICNLR